MQRTTVILSALFMSFVSFSGVAAEKVTYAPQGLTPIKVISVLGASDPQDLEEQLSKKADKLGATKYKIIMTSSNDNSERGTAVIYR